MENSLFQITINPQSHVSNEAKTDLNHISVEIILAATYNQTCPVTTLRMLFRQDPQPRKAPLFCLTSRYTAFSKMPVLEILQERLRLHSINAPTSYNRPQLPKRGTTICLRQSDAGPTHTENSVAGLHKPFSYTLRLQCLLFTLEANTFRLTKALPLNSLSPHSQLRTPHYNNSTLHSSFSFFGRGALSGRLTDVSSLRMGCPPFLSIRTKSFVAHCRVHLQAKRRSVLCVLQESNY